MQGSLIFVVIVAVWAAYLVQHWVRRREEAAEVRSVDRFSQAMRVLQKRPLLPRTDLAAARPRSYTLRPGRSGAAAAGTRASLATRATVEVKRAVPVGSARSGSALVARSSVATSVAAGQRAPINEPLTRTDLAEVEPMSSTLAPQRPTDSGQARGPIAPAASPTSTGAPGPSLAQRRLRGALLVVALLWVPVSITLAVTGTLTWFSVPFALLTVAAVVFWLRTEAAADRATRTARGQGSSSLSRARAVLVTDTQAVATHAYASPEYADDGHEPTGAPSRSAAFFDGQASETAPAAQSASATEEGKPEGVAAGKEAAPLAAPGTWSPVPVPRPTYSMKAKASPPRMTEAGIPADVFATPEFADEADELDERGLFARRAVSG